MSSGMEQRAERLKLERTAYSTQGHERTDTLFDLYRHTDTRRKLTEELQINIPIKGGHRQCLWWWHLIISRVNAVRTRKMNSEVWQWPSYAAEQHLIFLYSRSFIINYQKWNRHLYMPIEVAVHQWTLHQQSDNQPYHLVFEKCCRKVAELFISSLGVCRHESDRVR